MAKYALNFLFSLDFLLSYDGISPPSCFPSLSPPHPPLILPVSPQPFFIWVTLLGLDKPGFTHTGKIRGHFYGTTTISEVCMRVAEPLLDCRHGWKIGVSY